VPSGRLRAPQTLQMLLAPLRTPFVEFDSPTQDEVDEVRVLAARPRLDLPQDLQVLLVPLLAAFQQEESLLARERIREEEPQERLVAELDRDRRPEEPVRERVAAGLREPVDTPVPAATRGVLALDQPFLLEPPQLRVDLPVARRPEETRRAVDDRLDVVARARPEREHPEHHRSDCRLLHIYLDDISWRGKCQASEARLQCAPRAGGGIGRRARLRALWG